MKEYKVHVYKGASRTGKIYTMKAASIQNLRKNAIAKFKSKKLFVDIYVKSKDNNDIGNIKINPKRKEIHWFAEGDVNKGYCIKASTGAIVKGACKRK